MSLLLLICGSYLILQYSPSLSLNLMAVSTKSPVMNSTDSQQPQENVVDKGENIINSEKASEEAIVNNCEEGKMHSSNQNIETIKEKLSDAIDSINYVSVVDLLKELDDSAYESTLQKLLGQANDKITNLEEGEQKEALEQIIVFLKNELKHTAATLPVDNNVEAAASSQEAPLVESKESSPSLSSKEDDFSKLEGDKSDAFAGTSSDSNSNSPFEEINEESHEIRIPVIETVEPEATVSTPKMPSMITEKKPGNIEDDNYVSVSSDQGQDAQPEVLASELEIENINNDITVNQSAGRVEQMANEDTQSEPVVAAGIVSRIESDSPSLSSEDDKLESDDSARISSDSPSFDIIDETEVLEIAAAMTSMVTEEKSDNLNDEKNDQQNFTIPTAVDQGTSPIPVSQCGTAYNEEDFTVLSQSSSLGFANKSLNTVIHKKERASNHSIKRVANEDMPAGIIVYRQNINESNRNVVLKNTKGTTVATWMFAVTGVLALAAAPAAYFALGTSLLVAGVAAGIGVFCIVAAIAIHYCNKAPSGPLKGPDVEKVVRNAAVEVN